MAARQGRGERAAELDRDAALARRGPARRHRAARARTCPRRPSKLLARARRRPDDSRSSGAALRRARRRGARVEQRARQLFPQARARDRLPHPPRPRAGARGRAGGRRARGRASGGSSRSASTRASCRAALAAAEALRRGVRRRRPPPQRRARATTTPSPPSCASSPPTRAAWRSARPGSTTTATTRRAPTRSARSPPTSRSRARLGKPLVIHTRAAEDDTIATLAGEAARARGDPALLLDARPARRVPRARLVDLVRRQRHLPEGAGPRRGGRARPARPPAGGDRRAVPDAAGRAQGAQPARRTSSTPRASSPSAAGSPTRSSRRRWRPTPPGCSGW